MRHTPTIGVRQLLMREDLTERPLDLRLTKAEIKKNKGRNCCNCGLWVIPGVNNHGIIIIPRDRSSYMFCDFCLHKFREYTPRVPDVRWQVCKYLKSFYFYTYHWFNPCNCICTSK